MFGRESKKAVENADVVLIVGTYLFPEVFPELNNPFRKDAQVFHIDLDAYEIAKNHPVTLGICTNPAQALQQINDKLEKEACAGRIRKRQNLSACRAEQMQEQTTAAAFMETLRRLTDENLIIFDEALTASGYVTSYLPRSLEGTFFQTRGGSLGVGIPGGMGILLARPKSQAVVFTGDGGSMYTIQALYTANRYHIPVKVVICNNRRYHLLDRNLEVYRKEQGILVHEEPESFSLEPVIDFVALARSMGIDGIAAQTREQAKEAAEKMVCAKDAFVVDLNTVS